MLTFVTSLPVPEESPQAFSPSKTAGFPPRLCLQAAAKLLLGVSQEQPEPWGSSR